MKTNTKLEHQSCEKSICEAADLVPGAQRCTAVCSLAKLG